MVVLDPQPMLREELEQLLNGLPNPRVIIVTLHGSYNLADLAHETNSLVPGAKVHHIISPKATFALEPPYTNDLVLRLYSHESVPRSVAQGDNRTMYLERVEWKLGRDATVTLEPCALTIRYEGKEPRYVTQLRAKLKKPIATTMTVSTVSYG